MLPCFTCYFPYALHVQNHVLLWKQKSLLEPWPQYARLNTPLSLPQSILGCPLLSTWTVNFFRNLVPRVRHLGFNPRKRAWGRQCCKKHIRKKVTSPSLRELTVLYICQYFIRTPLLPRHIIYLMAKVNCTECNDWKKRNTLRTLPPSTEVFLHSSRLCGKSRF